MAEASTTSLALEQTIILLGAAVIAVPIFRRLGLGSVLGYLAAGLLIGPFGLKLVSDPAALLHLAELGVVMFLFIIGLEMRPRKLWNLRHRFSAWGQLRCSPAAPSSRLPAYWRDCHPRPLRWVPWGSSSHPPP